MSIKNNLAAMYDLLESLDNQAVALNLRGLRHDIDHIEEAILDVIGELEEAEFAASTEAGQSLHYPGL